MRIPPFGRRFSRHPCLPIRCDLGGVRKATSTLAIIVSISPPGYPSVCLRPSIARICFTWQGHCSSDRRWRFAGNQPGRKCVIQPVQFLAIAFKNAAIANDDFDACGIIEQLYPDQEAYKKEE